MRYSAALLSCALVVFSSFLPTCSYAHSVNARQELVITDLRVIEDPVRSTGCGAWTFCALMTAMAGTQNPSTFTKNWLVLWNTSQTINGYPLPKRNKVNSMLVTPWPKLSNGDLDLTRAPYRLLAIVHRPDLNEGRFVFGALEPNGTPMPHTVIFEYHLSENLMSRANWIYNWHLLGSMTPGSSTYNSHLQYLTDTFARTPEMFGRIALKSLRSNDGHFAWQSFEWTDWEWRQWTLSWGPNFTLQQDMMTQTPHTEFNTGSYSYRTKLRDFINANTTYILAGNHSVGLPLKRSGSDLNLFGWGYDLGGINNQEARFRFSMATCSGCHGDETQNGGNLFHIRNRYAGVEAQLSPFFGTAPLWDAKGQYRVHDEMGRRVTIFAQLLQQYSFCSSSNPSWTGGGAAAPASAPPSAGVAGPTNPIPARVH